MKVEEVLYHRTDDLARVAGQTIEIVNLSQALHEGNRDVSGDALLLLPLRSAPEGGSAFEVVPVPPSPGYTATTDPEGGPLRVYLATPESRAQYRHLPKAP